MLRLQLHNILPHTDIVTLISLQWSWWLLMLDREYRGLWRQNSCNTPLDKGYMVDWWLHSSQRRKHIQLEEVGMPLWCGWDNLDNLQTL